MNMNPFQIMQMKEMLEVFHQNHPKLPLFFRAVSQNAMQEGTIIEMTVKTPDGKDYCTNLRLNASDIEMLQKMREMKG